MKHPLGRIGFGLLFLTVFFTLSVAVYADSLFKEGIKIGGSVYKMAGEKMEQLGEERKDSLVGKSLRKGGKLSQSAGNILEEVADNMEKPTKKKSEKK